MEQLMQSKMLDNRREHNQATAALIHIKEQHKDILELEKSIIELHQIFVDMAALVDAQGELIDQIEYNGMHCMCMCMCICTYMCMCVCMCVCVCMRYFVSYSLVAVLCVKTWGLDCTASSVPRAISRTLSHYHSGTSCHLDR
jgi:Syntaxin